MISSAARAVMDAPVAHPMGPADCGDMEIWDYAEGMCLPFAMPGMPMSMVMVHGNGFAAQTVSEKPRGQDAFSVPNMFMVDAGKSVGDRHYVNLDFMGTLERWTFPTAGSPELLQIGEENAAGQPYVDAQHPHSSPIMGLTLSDTIWLGAGKDHLKVWVAPRGQATDGPVAFMHRPTGMVNPDTPLGHHIGQDVGHITSSVVGVSLRAGETNLEASTFHGAEPEPSKVDLPVGELNSYAARITRQFTPHFYAMASGAFVKNPEPHEPDLDHIWRYSASAYVDHSFESGWMLHDALIWGLVNGYDHASALNSFAEEFWFHRERFGFWGRLEVLQRTAEELAIEETVSPHEGKWVTALTLGVTRDFARWESFHLAVGASVTKDFLPSEFRPAYAGDPVSGKIFVQASGMRMWDL